MTSSALSFDGLAVGPEDITEAAKRIAPYAVRTPLITNKHLDELTGARVFIKPECLQQTGAFKFRGAMNSLLSLSKEDLGKGVLAWSSGNHGQAVARAAKLLDTTAVIVMPADAPRLKLDATRSHGAEIVTYNRQTESREDIGMALAAQTGRTIIPPFDYGPTIAGQGTLGLEIAQDLAAQNLSPDLVVSPAGGGGLISGVSIAIKHKWPEAQIFSVEPNNFDDTLLSLEAGERTAHAQGAQSICDALQAYMPGELTFPIQQRLLSGGVTVSDEDALRAMGFAFRHLKLVIEPGGAVALAALLNNAVPVKDKTVAVIISGGNVDADMFQKALDLSA